MSVTDRCNLRCRYCRPARGGDGERGCAPALDGAALVTLVERIHAERPIAKVRLTGGEPLLRRDIVEIVAGLRLVLPRAELCLTTNAVLLTTKLAFALRRAGLDRVNISLDALDPGSYAEMTRGGDVTRALAGARAARAAGFDRVRFNAVLVRSKNLGDLEDLVRFAARERSEIRFIELMPLGIAKDRWEDEFVGAGEVLERLSSLFTYEGGLSDERIARRHRFDVDGDPVDVGLITAVSHPFCRSCNRLRLDCRGVLYSCLRSSRGFDLGAALRSDRPDATTHVLTGALEAARYPSKGWTARAMSGIGG